MVKCCPTCHQTLPNPLPHDLQFRGVKNLILRRVHKAGGAGIRSDLLFDHVYGDDPNGGPETGMKILAVHIWHMNKTLKSFGLKIKSLTVGRGGYGNYVLVKLP